MTRRHARPQSCETLRLVLTFAAWMALAGLALTVVWALLVLTIGGFG